MGRVVRALGSLRFTVGVIVALTVLLVIGFLIPQRGLMPRDVYLQWRQSSPDLVAVLEASGLTEVHTSPWAWVLWSLFFVNLGLVMWGRIPLVRAKVALHPAKIQPPKPSPGAVHAADLQVPGNCEQTAAERFFAARGLATLSSSTGFYAVRHRLSPVATLLFHLSFFVILIGGLTTVYTRFSGRVDLAEGEAFSGDTGQFVAPPRVPLLGQPPWPAVMVERIEPRVVEDTPVGIVVTFRDRQGRTGTAEINRPFRIDGLSFVIQDLGVAPAMAVMDGEGAELDAAWVKLEVLQGKTDHFEMGGLSFEVEFFPDLVIEEGQPRTRSQEFANPAFRITATRDGQDIGTGIVRPGERLELDDGVLEIHDLRFWVRLYLRSESGLWIVWTGFGVAALALVWRLVFYRREFWGTYRQEDDGTTVLRLVGRSELYRALFEDEFRATAAEMQRSLAGSEPS